jgi:hypothetical protein
MASSRVRELKSAKKRNNYVRSTGRELEAVLPYEYNREPLLGSTQEANVDVTTTLRTEGSCNAVSSADVVPAIAGCKMSVSI